MRLVMNQEEENKIRKEVIKEAIIELFLENYKDYFNHIAHRNAYSEQHVEYYDFGNFISFLNEKYGEKK